MKKSLVRAQVLEAVGNAISLEMLTLIAKGKGCKTKDLIAQLHLSRRVCYTRISKFLNTGLIARRHGKWHLTKFGVVIYGVILLLAEEINVIRNNTTI